MAERRNLEAYTDEQLQRHLESVRGWYDKADRVARQQKRYCAALMDEIVATLREQKRRHG